MSPKHTDKWAFLLACCTIAAALPFGCNPFATYSHSNGGPPAPVEPAEYPLVLKDGSKKSKEVVVAVFVRSTPGIRQEFEGSNGQLVSDTARKLQEMAKESQQEQRLVVLDPALVNKFKKKTPDWNRMHPSQWGKELSVDYVLDIHLNKMSLYQPGSSNQFYEGHAEVTVDAYDVGAGIAEPKYHYVYQFRYPHTGALEATSMPLLRFRLTFVEHLAVELAMKHVEHKQGSGIADDK